MSQSEFKRTAMIERLFAVLADLSLQNGLKAVKVNEISQAAGIHRATFYRHLESKDDLLERGTHIFWDEILVELEEYHNQHPGNNSASTDTGADEVPGYIIFFFILILERRKIFLSFLNNNGSLYFYHETRKRIRDFMIDQRLSAIDKLNRKDNASEFVTSCLLTTLEIVTVTNSLDAVADYYRFATRGIAGLL